MVHTASGEPPRFLCAWNVDTDLRVIEAARWLAEELDGSIVLAHAFDAVAVHAPVPRELAYAAVTNEQLARDERAHVTALLERAAVGLAPVPHTIAIGDGRTVPVLLSLAAEHHARLVVTGTRAGSPLDRILIGSVSSTLANRAGCPVLVVGDDATVAASGPVVAGYDGSDDSRRAARHGAALAARLGRQLVLVHVAERDADRVRADRELAEVLHDAISVLDPAPQQRLEATIATASGEPADELARLARERDAALLVIGTRGRGALKSALLGSVSAGVVRHAGPPVVLVGPAAEHILPC